MQGRDQSRINDIPCGVVGSIGSQAALESLKDIDLGPLCDVVEVRLDVLDDPADPSIWSWLRGKPLLITARRFEEGGKRLGWSADERARALVAAMEFSSCLDLEVASIAEMGPVIEHARRMAVPWIASYHDFEGFPAAATIAAAAASARDAGAAAFKLAVSISDPAQLGALAAIQLADYGLPVASMGMGPLAVVSRLLCAQCGSILNYGYLGDQPTAPGQWDAASLRSAISQLPAWR